MFHNIFSKKQKRRMHIVKPKIIADIHEKDSLIFEELKESKEINLEITSLKIADFLISNIAIERKNFQDFVSSMISKRLLEQINQMQIYDEKLIIIEGEMKLKEDAKLNMNAIRGFILSISLIHKIPIIFTKDYKETTKYLIVLAKQREKNPIVSSLHSRIPKTLKEQKQYALESFPNIGPKKAELLLKKFKSLNNVFNSSEEELKEILKKQTIAFKNLLNS